MSHRVKLFIGVVELLLENRARVVFAFRVSILLADT